MYRGVAFGIPMAGPVFICIVLDLGIYVVHNERLEGFLDSVR